MSDTENFVPITETEFDSINVATQEGLRRLSELAKCGPIFRVLHACDWAEYTNTHKEMQ